MTITEFTIINGCSLTTVQTAATFDACCREHDGQCRKTRHNDGHIHRTSRRRESSLATAVLRLKTQRLQRKMRVVFQTPVLSSLPLWKLMSRRFMG